jgi:putative ABC transport system permease protein
VPVLQGRNFNDADTPKSPRVAIVNETMAHKFWPNENAIGKRFRLRGLDGPEVQIVGIAADHKVSSLGEAPTPYIHYAISQAPDPAETIVTRGRGDAGALLNMVRREIAAVEPNAVFLENQTMDTQVAATLLPAKLGAIAISSVGAVAMALAAIGLYGVIAYAVARRSREIGIRMALGAQPSAVVAMVLRQGLGLAAVGLGVGAVVALGAAAALSKALYGISIVDPIAWGMTLATLLTVAALANVVPARRAAIIDPSSALRAE